MRRSATSIRPSNSTRHGQATPRAGAAAIEFAIVLPLLVMVLAATIDFSRFAYTSISVSNAARAGAGYGIFHPLDEFTRDRWIDRVAEAAADELVGWGAYDTTKLVVTADFLSSGGDKRAVVTVSYPFKTQVNWGFFPSTMTIQQKTVLPMIR